MRGNNGIICNGAALFPTSQITHFEVPRIVTSSGVQLAESADDNVGEKTARLRGARRTAGRHQLCGLVFLEGRRIVGAVKPILEFLQELEASGGCENLSLKLVLFSRSGQQNELIAAIRARNIDAEVIAEQHAFDLRVVSQLRNVARKLQPALIWTNNTKSHFLIRLSGMSRTAEWIAFHHGYTMEAWRTRIYNELDRLSLPKASLVVTVCDEFKKQLQAKGVRADRLRVVRNPIRICTPLCEEEKATYRRQLGICSKTSVILSIGRLSREKGHTDLLYSLALLRNMEGPDFHSRLLIVGDGPEQTKLQALSSRLALSDVVSFLGHHSDVRPYYGIADVFVLPSYSEGCPNVLLEAMSYGLPIVATAVGGVPEILSHEISALLAPKRDASEMAKSIQRVLKDSSLRQRLSIGGREVARRLTPQRYCRNILRLFQEVLGEAIPS